MRPLLLLLALALHAAPARAQWSLPQSVRLNTPVFASDYCEVVPETDLEGLSAYTLEAWVYPTSYAVFPTIFGNDYLQSFWLGLNTIGQVRFYPTGGSLNYVESGAVVPLDTWTHVAATYEQGVGWSILLNGNVVATGGTIVGPVGTSPAANLFIGADRETGSPEYFWQGWIDEARIWSERRSAAQIQSTMTVDVGRPYFQTPAYAALEANWEFHQTSTDFAFDRAFGLGRTSNLAYFRNGAVWDRFAAPMSPNTGVELNGVDDYGVIPMGDGFANGLSIEAWIAPRTFSGFPTIAGRDFETSFWLGLTGAGRLRFYPTGGVGNYVESVQSVPLNLWTHVAVTYRNGITTFFVNGKLDSQTGAITGPVGENGRVVHVGADNPFSFPFNGYLDEVRVTRGELSVQAVRAGMYRGLTGFINPMDVTVTGGMAEQWRHDFDGIGIFEVFGSDARLVKSGAAQGGSGWATHVRAAHDFHDIPFPLANLPDGDVAMIVTQLLDVPDDWTIFDTEVFVAAPTSDMTQFELELESPAGTVVKLIALGEGRGRDVHTVFRDAATTTLATGVPPYRDPVQPSQPLSAFNGESSLGPWELRGTASGGATCDFWAWGIRFNNIPVAVDPADASVAPSLRMAGAHPVRGEGALQFTAPAGTHVDLALFDVQGRRARTLFDGAYPGGTTRMRFRSTELGAGVYFAVLAVDGAIAARQRVVIVE